MTKFLWLLIPLVVCSCAMKSSSANRELIVPVIGKWEWIKTRCCGRRPEWSNPETTNTTASIEFKADSTLTYSYSDRPSETYSFSISKDSVGNRAWLMANDERALISLRNDTLIIDYGYMDLATDFYIRKP